MELPMLDSALDKLQKDGYYQTNPYWEKWKKGRPSKEKKLLREQSDAWEWEQMKKYPERTPMLSFILQDNKNPKVKEKKGKGKTRTVTINYIQRSY